MEFRVFMQSNEYGREEFDAENKKDAISIVLRLIRQVRKMPDTVEREVGIVLIP